MRTRWLWLAAAALAPALAQSGERITREGRHWVGTVEGGTDVESALKVNGRGGILLHGEDRRDVAYVLKKRAAVRTEQQAREIFARMGVKAQRVKNLTVLTVFAPEYVDEACDLQLRVPRKLKETNLETRGGGVEAYDLDGGLLVNTGGGAVQIDRIRGWAKIGTGGGQIRIGKVGGPLKGYSAGGSIYVDSAGGDAYLETGGGDIVVGQASGRVQATAGSGGNIRIERADGGATLSTGGGLIDVLHASGPVHANTGAGGIKIRYANGVQCVSGAGQIQLRAVYGAFQAATAAGSIIAELESGKHLENSQLVTQSGDITVYIPSKLPVTIDATNTSPGGYRIVSDFPEIRPWLEGGNTRSKAHGALNGGGPVLSLAASGGTIYLRRRD